MVSKMNRQALVSALYLSFAELQGLLLGTIGANHALIFTFRQPMIGI